MQVGLPRQVSARELAHARRPRFLQLAITLPGWIRSSVTSGHAAGFGRLLREPGKDNTDLAFLVPTWLTCYRCGFSSVVAHVITNSRAVSSTRRSSRSTDHEDGRRKSARGARDGRCSRISPLQCVKKPLPCERITAFRDVFCMAASK